MFRKYHYLNYDLHASAVTYLLTINDEPAAFIATHHFPHPIATNMKKVHRLVVLPDYQGIGIGIKLLEFVGELWIKRGMRFTITTSNPALMHGLNKRDRWRCMRFGRVGRNGQNSTFKKQVNNNTNSGKRITTSFEML